MSGHDAHDHEPDEATGGADDSGTDSHEAGTDTTGADTGSHAEAGGTDAVSSPTGVSRRKLLVGGASVAAAAAAAAGGVVAAGRLRDPGPATALVAAHVDEPLPTADPTHAAWERARYVRLPLVAQTMAAPWLHDQTCDMLTVRALCNAEELAFRLEWDDEEAAVTESIATFGDSVAVMLPAAPGGQPPPIFMGWEGQPVYIAHWRASWQSDADDGFRDVGELFPGSFNDVHPEDPALAELGLDAGAASVFAAGHHVGNPVSARERVSPVEELTAEGYGTLEHLPDQRATGRGQHADGRWRVTIGFPVRNGNAPALATGQSVKAAFAVWQGQREQVGGRKQYVDWVDLTLGEG